VKIVRYEDILKVLEELNITMGPAGETIVRGYSFEEYKKLAKQTEQVDYDCDFHNGICQGRMIGAPGCCHHCHATFGYWCKEPQGLDEATVKTMAEYYNPRTGFLEEGAGCILCILSYSVIKHSAAFDGLPGQPMQGEKAKIQQTRDTHIYPLYLIVLASWRPGVLAI
jgi:hypothetical protein